MKRYKFIILSLFAILSLPAWAQAYSAQVVVDTRGENINALEATIHVPRDVKIDKVSDGNSAITFWIKSPVYDARTGTIVFSGITPGGWSGQKQVLVFSGELTKDDLVNFTFSEVSALRNDGSGSAVPVKFSLVPMELTDDVSPPENFVPVVGVNKEIFDGQFFLAFSTTDKGVGIDHYEVKEGYWDSFVSAESPYLLLDQSLHKTIYVKAVDKSGNERVVTIGAPKPLAWYEHYLLFAILLVAFFLGFVIKKLWRRSLS